MYAEELLTPHERKTPAGHDRQRLVDSLDLPALSSRLTTASFAGAYALDIARVEIADEVSREVNRSLWYPQKDIGRRINDYKEMGLSDPLPLSAIKEKQAANCLGYTYVASEILDHIGLDHWIGYGNGHGFIVLAHSPDNSQQSVWLIDPLKPRLNGRLDEGIKRGDVDVARRDVNEWGRSLLMVDMRKFCNNLKVADSYESLAEDSPWLMYEPDKYSSTADEKRYQRQEKNKNIIIISIYGSEDGKRVIQQYTEYKRSVSAKDVKGAGEHMKNMYGMFPDIDVREVHRLGMRGLVRKICTRHGENEAVAVIRAFEESFSRIHDTRAAETAADLYRTVASASGSLALTEQAEVLYDRASRDSNHFRRRIEGKRDKLSRLKNRLTTA